MHIFMHALVLPKEKTPSLHVSLLLSGGGCGVNGSVDSQDGVEVRRQKVTHK